MNTDLSHLQLAIRLVSLFRDTGRSPVLTALGRVLAAEQPDSKAAAYSDFLFSLQAADLSLSDALLNLIETDDNRYIRLRAANKPVPPALEALAQQELRLFSALTALTPEDLFPPALLPAPAKGQAPGAFTCALPRFVSTPTDFCALYAARLRDLEKYGFGLFASADMFRMEAGRIVPIFAADALSEADFVGYETQRAAVKNAFLALLQGLPAENVLLYGDAGTGKSSTVKALARELAPAGLRLIELKKDQLVSLPDVADAIRAQPLKFVIFIDDLSFRENDDRFSMLKATLEGSAAGAAPNAILCATSNRRHIVKETFADRAGDDVHRGDTMAELMSLSDRFGLTVYFEKPAKAQYLEIVRALAKRAGLEATDALLTQAEAYALKKGSRSPRAAKQFVSIAASNAKGKEAEQ